MSLQRSLSRWVQAGLIDAETAQRIEAHEASLQRPVAQYAMVGLGAATLALGLIVSTLLVHLVDLTGGTSGILIPKATYIPVLKDVFPYVILAFFALAYWLVRNLTKRSLGRALVALRDDPAGAAALGVPVIGTRLGGTPEAIVVEESGFLVNPFDVADVAVKALTLIQNDALRSQLGEGGRRRVAKWYTVEQMATAYEAIYQCR